MNIAGFKLNHWKLAAVISVVYILVDVGLYVRNRMRDKEPIFSKDLFKTLLGGD